MSHIFYEIISKYYNHFLKIFANFSEIYRKLISNLYFLKFSLKFHKISLNYFKLQICWTYFKTSWNYSKLLGNRIINSKFSFQFSSDFLEISLKFSQIAPDISTKSSQNITIIFSKFLQIFLKFIENSSVIYFL